MSKAIKNQLRRQLAKRGLSLRKSRKGIHAHNIGSYMVVDIMTNTVVIGADYEYSLDEISDMIREGRL